MSYIVRLVLCFYTTLLPSFLFPSFSFSFLLFVNQDLCWLHCSGTLLLSLPLQLWQGDATTFKIFLNQPRLLFLQCLCRVLPYPLWQLNIIFIFTFILQSPIRTEEKVPLQKQSYEIRAQSTSFTLKSISGITELHVTFGCVSLHLLLSISD